MNKIQKGNGIFQEIITESHIPNVCGAFLFDALMSDSLLPAFKYRVTNSIPHLYQNKVWFDDLQRLIKSVDPAESSKLNESNGEVAKRLFSSYRPDAVLILADGFSIPVNRLFMAQYSPFFMTAFFNSNFLEKSKLSICLKYIKLDPLLATLIYFLKCVSNNAVDAQLFDSMRISTCINILDVAAFLQLEPVLTHLSDVIYRKVTDISIIQVYGLVEIRYAPLADRLWELIVRNFNVLVTKNKYLQLNAGQLIKALKNPFLNVQPHEEISIVRKWLLTNSCFYESEELQELQEACLRYEESKSNNLKMVNSHTAQIPKYSLDPVVGSYFMERHRYPQSLLMAVGGWDQTGPANHIEFYEPNRRQWFQVEKNSFFSPKERRAYHALVMNDNEIFILGGFDGEQYHRSIRNFSLNTKLWTVRAPMLEKRCYVGGALLGEAKIIAVGGYNERERMKSVEVLDIAKNQWTRVASMNFVRSDADCVNLRERIYSIGGFNGGACLNTGEYFDPAQNKWFSISKEMKMRRSGLKVVTIGGVIMVVGGYTGSIRIKTPEFYDPREGNWHVLSDMSCQRSNFGIQTLDSTVLVCGGYCSSVINQSEQYEWRTNRWITFPSLVTKKSALSICRIDRHQIIEELLDEYDFSLELPL